MIGYVSLPSLTRSNRSAIDLFVNHRSIEDRTLAHAVVQAFHTLLPVGRYPLATIFVTLDPAEVDVNVHPQKTQVRFAQERRVFSAVQKAVRRALVGAVPAPDMTMDEEGRILPASGPGGQPAPDVATWFARRDTIVNIDRQHHLDLYVPPPSSQGRTLGLPASPGGQRNGRRRRVLWTGRAEAPNTAAAGTTTTSRRVSRQRALPGAKRRADDCSCPTRTFQRAKWTIGRAHIPAAPAARGRPGRGHVHRGRGA